MARQVWAMKRRVAPSGANVPMQTGRPLSSPSQMEMHTALLTDAWVGLLGCACQVLCQVDEAAQAWPRKLPEVSTPTYHA